MQSKINSKLSEVEPKRVPEATQIESKGRQDEPRIFKTPPCGTNRKREQKGVSNPLLFGVMFVNNSIKNAIGNSFKNQSRKNMKSYTKGLPKRSRNRCQNSSRINAKTGTEQIRKIHVFLKCKNMQIHCKGRRF